MSQRIPAGSAAELIPGNSRVIDGGPEPIAVFNLDGRYFACSQRCPHAGGPLSDGMTRGTEVVCPWHGWAFDLCATGDDAKDGVIRYTVVEEDGALFVEIQA